MDWGVYDLATLFEVMRPRSIEVLQAWMSRPETAVDPTDTVFDIETHVGATLRAEIEGGRTVVIDYERASGTHAEQKLDMQIEGTKGAAAWKWIPFPVESTELRLRTDADGRIKETISSYPTADTVHFHHRPLVYSRRLIAGETTSVLADDDALFNFAVIQAIYRAAAGAPAQVVARSFAVA
jgi:hypothetical protein